MSISRCILGTRWIAVGCLMAGMGGVPLVAEDSAADSRGDSPAATVDEKPVKRLFRGQVVLVSESLKRRGIKAYEEELAGQVALETSAGDLLPILPDWRGRALFQDQRLRNRDVELVAFRRSGVPYLQVLMIFTFSEKGRRQYTDYWCDICSIPMYEIKPCDCCQQDIRLRFQPQELPADVRE